ncbi:MAG: trehalase family glycosidase [Synergistaceae bacterium]|nr:trehalase family glycosidase [Synergistaceae bacterium]
MNASQETTALLQSAREVLDENWKDGFTVPAQNQYPYQWSWDSAFIAAGYARYDRERAQRELRSLFSAQWADGRVPHIVFHNATPDASYFPGPEFWQTEQNPFAPLSPRSSGIVQPPNHATAVLHIVRCAGEGGEKAALAFAGEMFPKLRAWHDWLYRERDPRGEGVVYIIHPWESGQDNSPLWDPVLARMDVPPARISGFRRRDTRAVAPEERPLDSDYDRYIFLVDFFRQRGYDERKIFGDGCPFLVQDVLFNTLLCRAEQDMAELARLLGENPAPFEARARRTADAVNRKLWNGDRGYYADYDLASEKPIPMPALAGFSPLFARIPGEERAETMLRRLLTPSFGLGAEQKGYPASSYDREAPEYSPRRYWRGPTWIQMNWLLMHGLRAYGRNDQAERLRRAIAELPAKGGFREYFNPETGEGHGAHRFSWTAALLIDVLYEQL